MSTDKEVTRIPIISICVPHYGGVSSHWWQEFQSFMNYTTETLQNTGKYRINLCTHSDQPADKTRNILIDMAMNVNSDYILWLDSDNVPPMNCIEQLINTMNTTSADLVSGLYFSKTQPYYPIIREYRDGGFWTIEDVDFGKRIKIDGCGFGICLMKTSILSKLEKPYFRFDFQRWGYKDIQLSEDLYFCKQMLDKNMKLICDTSIVSNHYGGCVGAMEFLVFKNIRQSIQKFRKDLIQDVKDYTKLSSEECSNRINVGSRWIKEEWNKINPKTDEEIKQFYKNTKNYIWDLTMWHTTNRIKFDIELVQNIKSKFSKDVKILDYGCGIGVNGFMLAQEGYSVTLADLDSYTLDFAQYRANKTQYPINVWKVDTEDIKTKFDVIFMFDMIEHMSKEEFKLMADKLNRLRHKDTVIYYSVSFGKTEYHPMHFNSDPEYERLIKDFVGDKGINIQ